MRMLQQEGVVLHQFSRLVVRAAKVAAALPHPQHQAGRGCGECGRCGRRGRCGRGRRLGTGNTIGSLCGPLAAKRDRVVRVIKTFFLTLADVRNCKVLADG